jgi:chemotaxis methyl-accepting protein methylase
VKTTITLVNEEGHDTLMSGVTRLKADLEKFVVRLLLKIPAYEDDEKYQREFFRTSVNVTKFFRDINHMSFFSKTVMDILQDSLDFKIQFPMKKV